MKKIFNELESKFGKWIIANDFICNCSLSDYYSNMYLNVVYNSNSKITKILKENGVYVGKSLSAFYKECGGMSLFCHSFVIYGSGKHQKGYSPLDIEQMNKSLLLKHKNWNSDLFSIGCYSYYEICLKKNSYDETLYVVNKKDLSIIHMFKNVDELIEFFITKISSFYFKNGLKIGNEHPTNNWMKNMCDEDIINF